jgi:hypothetical protein
MMLLLLLLVPAVMLRVVVSLRNGGKSTGSIRRSLRATP